MLTKRVPFSQIQSVNELISEVCHRKGRPELPSDVPQGLTDFIQSCWQEKSEARPSFKQIFKILGEIMIDVVLIDDIGREFWKQMFPNSVSTGYLSAYS
jgi:hypothetical protein